MSHVKLPAAYIPTVPKNLAESPVDTKRVVQEVNETVEDAGLAIQSLDEAGEPTDKRTFIAPPVGDKPPLTDISLALYENVSEEDKIDE